MSTKHVVHHVIEPGLAGDGFTAPEAAEARRKLETVKAVSADWFSDINAAIAEAGPGGIVQLSKNTEYIDTSGDPLLVLNGTQLLGEDRFTTVIKSESGSAIQAVNWQSQQTQDVHIENLTLHGPGTIGGAGGAGGVGIGLDARGMTRCSFDRLRIEGFETGVYFGGDTNYGGWTNQLWRSVVHGSSSGPALLFYGRTGVGRTGAATANAISVVGCIIYSKEGGGNPYGPWAIQLTEGEGNSFMHNDMGYGNCTVIRLGSMAQRNSIISNRTENGNGSVLIEGGSENRIISNSFHARSGASAPHVELRSNSTDNVVAWNAYTNGPTPHIVETVSGLRTTKMWMNGNINTTRVDTLTSGVSTPAIMARSTGDAHDRMLITGGGQVLFGDGATAPSVRIAYTSGSPEGVVYAPRGSICLSDNGNLYRKNSGSSNTGWVAV